MRLSDEDRKTMVGLEMEKADLFISQADAMVEQEFWDLAANRYYYSCFHAVQALFIYNGLNSRRHAGMLSQFGLYFIKPGTIEDRLGGFLSRMEQLRERGDYNCLFSVTKEEVEVMVQPAKELIERIKNLLQQPPTITEQ